MPTEEKLDTRDDTVAQLKFIAAELRIIAKEAIATAKQLTIRPPHEREALESIQRNAERLLRAGCFVSKEPDALEWIVNRCKIGLKP